MRIDPTDVLALLEKQGHLRELNAPRARLRGIRLAQVDLTGASLVNADLSGADLTGAVFSKADLTGANLSEANLKDARFDGADLRKARLRDANLSNTNFDDSKLTRANLSGATLFETSLERIQAEDADLSRVLATGTTFASSSMNRINLGGARMTRVDLTGCHLEEAFFERTRLSDVKLAGAVLTRANMVNLRLDKADSLEGTDLRDVDLAEARLVEVSFAGADLSGALLDQVTCADVSFEGAALERTDFQGVRGISEEQLEYIRSRGGIVDALLVERAWTYIRQNRFAQVAVGLSAALVAALVTAYLTHPAFRQMDDLIMDAQELRDANDPAGALELYDLLIERTEGRLAQQLPVLYEKAEAQVELENFDDAADSYAAIVVMTEDDRGESINAQIKQADALSRGGQYERAIALLEDITDDEANSPKDVARSLLALSLTYQKMGLEDQALQIFKETVARFPHDPEVAFDVNLEMCEVYIQRRHYTQAEQLLTRLQAMVRDDSQRTALLILEARLYEGMGARDKSLAAFEELLKRYPESVDISPEVKMDLAQLVEDKGEYDWAARIYKDIVARTRDNLLRSQAQIAYGTLLRRLGRMDEAVALFRTVRREATGNQELQGASRLEEAEALAASGRYDDAFELLDEAIGSSEEGLAASAMLRRGQLLVEIGRFDEATSVFDQVIRRFSTQNEVVVTARMDLARLEVARGNGAAAIPLYEELLEDPAAEPFVSHLLNDLGHAYADLQQMDEAKQTFERLLARPDDSEAAANARLGLARVAIAAGDRARAAALYREIVAETTDLALEVTAMDTLARMYAEAGQIGQAISAFQTILEMVPPNHDGAYSARRGMAQLFESQGEQDKAEALYLAILESADRDDIRANTYVALGMLYLDQGVPDKAIDAFEEVRDEYPELGFDANLGLAQAYRAKGKTGRAIRLLEALVDETPDPRRVARALDDLSQLYQEAGRTEDAYKVGQKMMAIAGQDPEVQLNASLAMAASLREQGKLQEALELYQRLEQETSDHNLLLTLLDAQAQAYSAMERYDLAARAYGRIVSEYKDNLDIHHNAMMGLATSKRGEGQTLEAARLFEQVATETIDQGLRQWALESAAQSYSEAGQPEKARDILARGDGQRPLEDEDALTRADRLVQMGEQVEALALYISVSESSSNPSERAWAEVHAGQVLSDQEKDDKALEHFSRVVEQYPGELEQVLSARLAIAAIFHARNKTLEATARYEDIGNGDSFPDYRVTAALAAAELYEEQKLPNKARLRYEAVLQRFPDRPEGVQRARLGLARLALADGRHDEALEMFEKLEGSATLLDVRADALVGLARAYAAAGNREAAGTTYQRLKQQFPDRSKQVGKAIALPEGG